MGLTVSKNVGRGMHRVASTKRMASSKSNVSLPPTTPPATTVANPANFTRGEGPERDIRDVEQERYLKSLQTKEGDDESKNQATELPPDLLKFLTDVGPLKQVVDSEFTSPRLLEEGQAEIKGLDSAERPTRKKRLMPLVGENEEFTTTRSTNFSRSSVPDTQTFGVSNLDLYSLLAKKIGDYREDDIINSFFEAGIGQIEFSSENEKQECVRVTKQAMLAIDLPALLKDSTGNYLGVHPSQIPGPEVKAVESIPESKVKLVLADVASKRQGIHSGKSP